MRHWVGRHQRLAVLAFVFLTFLSAGWKALSAGSTNLNISNTTPATARAIVNAKLTYNNVPIQFWGRIVDQSNQPLPGVVIKASVRKWTHGVGRWSSAHPEFRLKSDRNGLFEFSGESGDVFSVEQLVKDGYQAERQSAYNFGYGRGGTNASTPQQPFVFKMWRDSIRADVLKGLKRFRLVPDGRVYTIDLVTGKMSDAANVDGDFRLAITRPASVIRGKPFDWTCSVSAIDGGIIEEAERRSAMFLAPESGYLPEIQMAWKSTQVPWSDSEEKRLFLRSRNGLHHAAVTIHATAYYGITNASGAVVTYTLNTNGSRVLRSGK